MICLWLQNSQDQTHTTLKHKDLSDPKMCVQPSVSSEPRELWNFSVWFVVR